jgi:hypothetical protein
MPGIRIVEQFTQALTLRAIHQVSEFNMRELSSVIYSLAKQHEARMVAVGASKQTSNGTAKKGQVQTTLLVAILQETSRGLHLYSTQASSHNEHQV